MYIYIAHNRTAPLMRIKGQRSKVSSLLPQYISTDGTSVRGTVVQPFQLINVLMYIDYITVYAITSFYGIIVSECVNPAFEINH